MTTNQTISPDQFNRMVAIANDMGAHFAKEPSREKMLTFLDGARHELVDELHGPINREMVRNLNVIDRLLDIVEARRKEILAAA